MLRFRRLGWLTILGGVVMLGLACRPTSHDPIVSITQAPGFQIDSLKSVAYLGMGSSVADPRAVAMMEPAVQRQLLTAALPFLLVRLEEVERRVTVTGAEEDYRAVRDYWRDAKKLDKFRAEQLCQKLGVDGLLVGTVVDWLQTDAAAGAQQIASNKVIARLCLYPAGTGRPAWQVQVSHVIESTERELRPSDASQNSVRQRELERAPGSKVRDQGPAAPGFDAVVVAVSEALVKALAP
jgi:hypothetical protein